nr:hypothetical protein [Shiraia sp. slf14]
MPFFSLALGKPAFLPRNSPDLPSEAIMPFPLQYSGNIPKAASKSTPTHLVIASHLRSLVSPRQFLNLLRLMAKSNR